MFVSRTNSSAYSSLVTLQSNIALWRVGLARATDLPILTSWSSSRLRSLKGWEFGLNRATFYRTCYICVQDVFTFVYKMCLLVYKMCLHLCTRRVYICEQDVFTFVCKTCLHLCTRCVYLCTRCVYICVQDVFTFVYKTCLLFTFMYIVQDVFTFVYRTCIHL